MCVLAELENSSLSSHVSRAGCGSSNHGGPDGVVALLAQRIPQPDPVVLQVASPSRRAAAHSQQREGVEQPEQIGDGDQPTL